MILAGKLLNRYLSLCLPIVLLLGCAKSISPPGGPIDDIPPEIRTTIPPSGSVSFPIDSSVIIEFSENIDGKSVKNSVFITPTVNPEPKIMVSGNKLKISPRQPFKENRTYVITLGTDLKDAHGVRITRPLVLAFATGPTIDTGVISGAVYIEDNSPAANMSIALFEQLPQSDSTIVDSLIPDYITQSGSDGRFAFTYIPPQDYFLIAFEDANKNRRINPVREKVGLPTRAIAFDSSSSEISDIRIRLSKSDDAPFSFRSVSYNQNNLLKLRLTKPVDQSVAGELMNALSLVTETGDTLGLSEFVSVSAYPSGDFLIVTDVPDSIAYTLSADLKPFYPQIDDSLRFISYTFTPAIGPDIAAPVISRMIPADSQRNVYPDSLMRVIFDEPAVTANDTDIFRIIDQEDTIDVAVDRPSLFEISLIPQQGLSYGHEYAVNIDGSKISDRSGNRLSDSITTTFYTIGDDTLGSLSGGIQYTREQEVISPIVLSFNPAKGEGEAKSIILDRGQIEFLVDLLPGFYTISGYKDTNGNGSYDFGSIIPYRTAEPLAAPSDTLRVRSRFVTDGAIVEF